MLIRVFILIAGLMILDAKADIFDARDALKSRNYTQAKVLLKPLAEIGNAEAQQALGLMYYQGKGMQADKIQAFSWMFLASEYDYGGAIQYANQIFNELPPESQDMAKSTATKLAKQYGKSVLAQSRYPEFSENGIEQQRLTKVAQELSRHELRKEDIQYTDRRARTNNARVAQSADLISRLNRGYRHNAYDNLQKLELEDESGLVIAQFDVDEHGEVLDPEVLFSWPVERFDDLILDSIKKGTFAPATRDEKSVPQYGIVAERRIGFSGKNIFRIKYPQKFRYFLRVRKQALEDDNPVAKYRLANMLRAYGDLIGTEQPVTFQMLLLELAEKGFVQAQLDYAEFLIYQSNEVSDGLNWLIEAAKSGHKNAYYRLGDVLANPPNEHIKQDRHKARFWLNLAQQHGHEIAAVKLKDSADD